MKYTTHLLSLFSLLALLGCSKAADNKTITVGVTAGPHVEIMQFVQKQAREQDLKVKIVEFNDFILPNTALDEGALNMNSYQHKPFLDHQIKARGYKLTSIGKTILLPMRVYSQKYSSVDKLPSHAKIAIPNDPTNGARSLLLLESLELITLRPEARDLPNMYDIITNPKSIQIIEIEAPQIPLALPDVDAAVINTDWALIANLNHKSHIIGQEATDSPYANILVVRTQDKDNPIFEQFLKIYQSEATRAFIEKQFRQSVIPAW